MMQTKDNASDLIKIIHSKAPEYLDLLTATTDEEFLDAIDALLEVSITKLESNSKNFQSLQEEGLTGAFAMALTIPGLTVSQETNSNGHVDLTIVADHCVPVRKILGEAKIYKGPRYHIQGLEQLINRYITGRELRGFLIVYFRVRDIQNLVTKIRKCMDAEHPCLQEGETRNHKLKWSFLSTHIHSSGINLDISHIGCNLFYDESSSSKTLVS